MSWYIRVKKLAHTYRSKHQWKFSNIIDDTEENTLSIYAFILDIVS